MILEIPKFDKTLTSENVNDWEADDGNAHFVLKREHIAEATHLEMIDLCVSGLERFRVARDFANVYGEPYSVETDKSSETPIDHIRWLIAS